MLNQVQPKSKDEAEIIAFISGQSQFTYADIKANASGSQWCQRNLMRKLQRLDLVFMVGKDTKGRTVFSTSDRNAAHELAAKKRKEPTGLMWTAMRSLKSFSPDEVLTILSETLPTLQRQDVQHYCSNLVKAEYLAVEQKARHGGRPAIYRLVKDTGPLAPTIRKLECIVDGNTDKLAYVSGDRL